MTFSKTVLKDGSNAFAVKVRQLVTKTVFASALRDHCFRQSLDADEFISGLKVGTSKTILQNELMNHGTQGEYPPGHFESSFEEGEQRNVIYDRCTEWIEKHFPYLK